MSVSGTTRRLAQTVLRKAEARGVMIATAESCTGGLIAAGLTDIAGSSSVFERGFVTYSNDAKTTLLGVPAATIDAHGAVSRPVALAMARGAVAASRAALAVSVTGVAGPGGGTPEKPVGLVWFGVHGPAGAAIAERRVFPAAGRAFIRERATQTALRLLLFHL